MFQIYADVQCWQGRFIYLNQSLTQENSRHPTFQVLTNFKEDLDSFEDLWFQIETYYGRDSHFAPFVNNPNLRVEQKCLCPGGITHYRTAVTQVEQSQYVNYTDYEPVTQEQYYAGFIGE